MKRSVTDCKVDYLIVDDRKLTQFAFERGCLDGLATVFKEITPSEFQDSWDESEADSVFRLREVRWP